MSSTIFCSNETVTLERTIENTDQEIKLDEIWNEAELQRCTSWIKTHAFKNVCLQFSDELLTFSIKITAEIREKSETNVFILGDTSYGACCVDEIAASHIQADAIIHFGNACLSKVTRLPVLYVFHKFSFDTGDFLQNVEAQVTDRDAKLMVFYDVGYYYAIDDAFAALKKVFGNAQIGKLAIDGVEPDILCWSMDKSSTEDFTCIYIGNDNQSFFNISMGIKCQKWLLYNPRSRELRETTIADSRWMRKRYFYIEKCKDAQSIGIVVGTLTTKGYLEMVHHIQEMAKNREVRSYMISVGKVNPAKLANFMDIDCFVLVGCPENTLYNSKEFYKPLVSVFEIEMAWNPAWKDQLPDTYCTDFTQLLPNGKLYKRDENAKFDENDISLVSGRVRHIASGEKPENGCQQLQELSKNQVAVTQAADVFNERSWKGLDPELGKNDPAKIEQGRKGIAIRYEENPKSVDF
ncbi:2-(3-amino-3-carboxypropyl)histidine synthase subunit 2 [Culicoides brevitarsis]|uniref:2-(3-amino-3-carboxypropyl)histidine synthase subunit 2 n=1 Tax=Culicoides brevitarsis TaxID=469753 RepID=UPI00307B52AB